MSLLKNPRAAQALLAAALMALLAGCSVLEEDRVDYTSAKRTNSLEVPPDLTQLSRETRYVVPGSVVTASGYQASAPKETVPVAASQVADVRIERAGDKRWLVVGRSADTLWGPVRDFWQENGFFLTLDQENLGIMETDWAENRAKLPQDIIRSTIGKVFDGLYSTGERDRFRTRLERRTDGGTEIFITHRGMVEVYARERDEFTVWQPRESDPELEAEFLRRLMVKLGVTQEQSKALLASGAKPSVAQIGSVAGQPVLQLQEGFDRAWRRVGVALDRTGFTVEDRNRSEGTYFVRYVAPDATKAEQPGFFGRLFGAEKKEAAPVRYRVRVVSEGEATTVSVLSATGQPEKSDTAQRIVRVLADDMR